MVLTCFVIKTLVLKLHFVQSCPLYCDLFGCTDLKIPVTGIWLVPGIYSSVLLGTVSGIFKHLSFKMPYDKLTHVYSFENCIFVRIVQLYVTLSSEASIWRFQSPVSDRSLQSTVRFFSTSRSLSYLFHHGLEMKHNQQTITQVCMHHYVLKFWNKQSNLF